MLACVHTKATLNQLNHFSYNCYNLLYHTMVIRNSSLHGMPLTIRYKTNHNQEVADFLSAQLKSEYGNKYDSNVIKSKLLYMIHII